MDISQRVETLRQHRPLLLAVEAIGWLHMAGKSHADFLRRQGGQKTGYEYEKWHEQETPPFRWDDRLRWVKQHFPRIGSAEVNWPGTLTEFVTKHRKKDPGILGMLQAGHGITSGIEKNLPAETSKYLSQDVTHMWLSTAFGHPVRNLLVDPPGVLTPQGWRRLIGEIERVLEELKHLGASGVQDSAKWQHWRKNAIGPGSYLRHAFLSTLAETRVPNNDVTLWDQSYVAAALFKSAVAGAVLEGPSYPWPNADIKQKTRWRLLTMGISTDHYEARAVKIGDWKGAQAAIEELFNRVCRLIEVDLAVGSLLYRDSSVCVFSFPGERFGETVPASWIGGWESWLQEQIDGYAQELDLEIPPYCKLSSPTRSLVPMVKEMRKVRDRLAVPVHRPWNLKTLGSDSGHVCPVCRVRRNGDQTGRDKPCKVCRHRRVGRRDAWLRGELGSDTIWLDEVSDGSGRIALLTFSLDLEPWLEGQRTDSLRAQAIREWQRHNPVLEEFWERNESRRRKIQNPISPTQCLCLLIDEVEDRVRPRTFDRNDLLLANLNEGYRHEKQRQDPRSDDQIWEDFYEKIVEDRSDSLSWTQINYRERAHWLAHQFFCKLISPGRVYRFWRQTEEFFQSLLQEFRQIAACHENSWRVQRRVLIPDSSPSSGWRSGEVYDGRWRDAPFSLLYLQNIGGFLTICNMARLLEASEPGSALEGAEIRLREEEGSLALSYWKTLKVKEVKDAPRLLGVYHPVIPLEVGPLRFRVLVPLETASACVDRAVAAWEEQFARVWDRLPLRVGVVAFPQKLSFQAVIEAARNLEAALGSEKAETWRVTSCDVRESVVALALWRAGGGQELRTVPIRLPDGRLDVFYPYVAVEDPEVRFPLDFQHPEGQVYRHVQDLRPGDGIRVWPARVAAVFLDASGQRFEKVEVRPLGDWRRMRELWELLCRAAPSRTALYRVWHELVERREAWKDPDGILSREVKETWCELVRAVFYNHLGVQGAALDALVEATGDGVLDWALDWHITALSEKVKS